MVHYAVTEKYNAHHDWSVNNKDPYSRFATLLIYLSDMPSPAAGGETAFPKAQYEGDRGLKILPKKGAAALFYDLHADGNGDDLSFHAAMPVKEGEKGLANLWVWA